MPKVTTTGSYGSCIFSFFKRLSNCFPESYNHFTVPPAQEFQFLYPGQHLFSGFFDSSHPDGCKVVSCGSDLCVCGSDLHFPNISDVEHRFLCLPAICISSLENCQFEFFAYLGVPIFLKPR